MPILMMSALAHELGWLKIPANPKKPYIEAKIAIPMTLLLYLRRPYTGTRVAIPWTVLLSKR